MKETRISINKTDLQEAAKNGSMSPLDVDPLWQALIQTQSNPSSAAANEASGFDIAQLVQYAGGVLVMIAMSVFMTFAEQIYGVGAVFGLSLVYTAGFAGLGFKLLKNGLKMPAGVLYTLAVLMTPVTMSSGMDVFHMDSFLASNAGALTIELTTAALGFFALTRVKTSLLSAPVYGSFWLISMTAAWMIAGGGANYWGFFEQFDHYNMVSMVIGLVILISAVRVDSIFGRTAGADYSWWGYLFGVAAFWIPLSLIHDGGELGKLFYFGINVLLMLASVVLGRRVLLVAGAIGAVYWVGHVLTTFFTNSLALSLAAILAGLGFIWLGLWYRNHKAAIEGSIINLVPASWQKLLPKRS